MYPVASVVPQRVGRMHSQRAAGREPARQCRRHGDHHHDRDVRGTIPGLDAKEEGTEEARDVNVSMDSVSNKQMPPNDFHIDVLGADHVRHAFPPHMHEEYAIAVTARGTHRLRLGRRIMTVHPGVVVALNPRELHAAEPSPDASWSYRMLYVSVHTMVTVADLLRDDHGSAPVFESPTIDDTRVADAVTRLYWARARSSCALELEQESVGMLGAVLRAIGGRTAVQRDSDTEPRAIALVRAYLHEHFATDVRLSTLGTLAGLNSCYLIRAFRKRVGIPPHAYLMQVRIARAQSMLGAGWPVSEVALATGFADQSHLTRQFKRALGITPGVYATANTRQRATRRRASATAESTAVR